MRKYILLPLLFLLTACPRPETFDLTYNGEPYCGGSQDRSITSLVLQIKGEGHVDPEFPLEVTRRALVKKGFRPSEIPMRMNYQQAVLPNGLVPIGTAYYQEWKQGMSEEDTRPLPLSPYNAPAANPTQEGQHWRAGMYIGLLDPNTMQMVRQRTYSWYFRSYPTAILAGPDGYIYAAGTTTDLAPLGQPSNPPQFCVDGNYYCMEAFILKIDPETMNVLWEKRLEQMNKQQNIGAYPVGDNLPLMMAFDTQRNHLLVGVGNFGSAAGRVFRFQASDGSFVKLLAFTFYPSFLFWHDQPGGDLYVAGYTNAYLPTGGWSATGRIPARGLAIQRLDSWSGTQRWRFNPYANETTLRILPDEDNHWVGYAMNPVVFPAPEGGINFSITAYDYNQYGYRGIKDDLTPRPTPVEEGFGIEENAERSYYGRIYPDGTYRMTTEILYPDPAFADQPLARKVTRVGGKFRVTFLERNGQSVPLLGIQPFSCFYRHRIQYDLNSSLNFFLPSYLDRDYNTTYGYPAVPYLPQQWTPGTPVGQSGRLYPMWLEIPGHDFNAAHLVKTPSGFISVTYYHSPGGASNAIPDLYVGGLTITRYRWK
ncbi:hypothetical protein [Meiothermus sp. CFH 77666]|uniref:hypothetical protein n=1 Tax=Meiothermus sp. CFH 77666 TaxID=2817942 RepID=UPI001AA03F65|nr:hypothetical protein [Meiothermus sp. CFH 77666]MBO1437349.1 hypothetical protein [Meiothermus sp. CFH 77666]